MKLYEHPDHLGNVRAVFSDVKLSTANVGVAPHDFEADLLASNNYYAFGSLQPGRWNPGAEGYRFGFNDGSERDDEITGVTGANFTTLYREADTRLGRWWGIDPKATAWESPYASMGNNPIQFNDPLGDTVRYKNVMDRIRVGIGRVLDSDFNKRFKREKARTSTYLYDRTKGKPSLLDSKPKWQIPMKSDFNLVEYSYGVRINASITLEKKVLGSIKKVEGEFRFYLPEDPTLSGSEDISDDDVVPNTVVSVGARGYPDIFRITVGGSTIYSGSTVLGDRYSASTTDRGTQENNSGVGGSINIKISSNRSWAGTMRYSAGEYSYYRYRRIYLPKIRISVK